MTEIQLKQFEEKCKEARSIMDNKSALNRIILSFEAEAHKAGFSDEAGYLEYFKTKKMDVILYGNTLTVSKKDFYELLKKTRDGCDKELEDLKICECEECKA